MSVEIFQKEACFQIQGAIFEVYREMGCGFLEAVYQECLQREFTLLGIPFVAQQELRLTYKTQSLQQTYRPDFICHESIIVELKALPAVTAAHKAQVLNYLKATGLHLGLLVNFGDYPKATIERVIF